MCGAGAHQVVAQELTRVRHAGRPNEGRASLAGQRAHIEAWRPATSRKVASAHVRDHPLVVCGGARSHRARIPTLKTMPRWISIPTIAAGILAVAVLIIPGDSDQPQVLALAALEASMPSGIAPAHDGLVVLG